MTLSEDICTPAHCERKVPVLATERLVLRAPCAFDAGAIAALANDRRIAANTARIPHPYSIADAEHFVASANRHDGQACFVICLDGAPIGAATITASSSAIGSAPRIGAAALPPKRCAPSSITPSVNLRTRRCKPVRA